MTTSVVMATYNGSAHIAEQLESILSGQLSPDELVIVDDASSDSTVSIIERFMNEYSGVQFILEQNSFNIGPSQSFAKGIGKSNGDLLLFADQDDVWMPEKIAVIADQFALRPGTKMIYHDGWITDIDLNITSRTIYNTRHSELLDQGILRPPEDIVRNPDIKGCTMALEGAFARLLFKSSNDPVFNYWGHDHWAALFAFGSGNVVALSEQLILHRFHGNNASSGTKLSLWNPNSIRRYLKAIRKQAPDHFIKRYQIALDQAALEVVPISAPVLNSLKQHLDLVIRRSALRDLPAMQRTIAVCALQREGQYKRHFNGWATALRDILG